MPLGDGIVDQPGTMRGPYDPICSINLGVGAGGGDGGVNLSRKRHLDLQRQAVARKCGPRLHLARWRGRRAMLASACSGSGDAFSVLTALRVGARGAVAFSSLRQFRKLSGLRGIKSLYAACAMGVVLVNFDLAFANSRIRAFAKKPPLRSTPSMHPSPSRVIVTGRDPRATGGHDRARPGA